MARKFRRGQRVCITRGLFVGEKGIVEDINTKMKAVKLKGRSWYPSRILKKC